jgi:hypothetical protein
MLAKSDANHKNRKGCNFRCNLISREKSLRAQIDGAIEAK